MHYANTHARTYKHTRTHTHTRAPARVLVLGAADVPEFELGHRMANQDPAQCAMLIYTSGTTGNPKGVMITHDNVTWTAAALINAMPPMNYGNEHVVSYLPLSHIAAQILDIHGPMVLGQPVDNSQAGGSFSMAWRV